jgi:hypothetical protein
MAEENGLTRREALTGLGAILFVTYGAGGQSAFAQEGPKSSPPLKLPYKRDLSTPQTTVDTFYSAMRAGDFLGLQEIVTPDFFFREGFDRGEKRSLREELTSLFYLFGPLELSFGDQVIQRKLGNWLGNPVTIYAPPLSDEEIATLKKGYPPFDRESEVDDFNKMRDIAIARVAFAHDLNVGEARVARSDVRTFLGLKKEETWKIFSAQPHFSGSISKP